MLHLELEAGDIGKLVKTARQITGIPELDKFSDFGFTSGGNLTFRQSFFLSTEVETSLSADDAGSLLIDIEKLAGTPLLDWPLQLFLDKITSIAAGSTSGVLVKTGRSQLKLDLAKILPVKAAVKKISIAGGKLAADIELG